MALPQTEEQVRMAAEAIKRLMNDPEESKRFMDDVIGGKHFRELYMQQPLAATATFRWRDPEREAKRQQQADKVDEAIRTGRIAGSYRVPFKHQDR